MTYHRAFNVTADPFRSLDDIIGLGVERLLTSGQEPSVLEGVELIAELVRRAGDCRVLSARLPPSVTPSVSTAATDDNNREPELGAATKPQQQ